MGNEALQIYSGWSTERKGRVTNAKTLLEQMKEHFRAFKCKYTSHLEFYRTKRDQKENVDDWLCQLRTKAEDCEFSCCPDDHLLEHFVSGINDAEMLEEIACKMGKTSYILP